MSNPMAQPWKIKGTIFIACNCDYGCPCNFNAPPTYGKCEGQWTWHVAAGKYGEVPLDGLNFSLFAKWPGAIHEGNGEALIFIDERANAQQRDAIATLIKGGAGGPWKILAWTWPTLHGTKFVPYTVVQDGIHSRVQAGSSFKLESEPIKNPVSGAEVHPAMALPEGLVTKRADLGSSKVFRLNDAIGFDHPGKYTAVGEFDYSGPPATT
jgi:hypothetical protein